MWRRRTRGKLTYVPRFGWAWSWKWRFGSWRRWWAHCRWTPGCSETCAARSSARYPATRTHTRQRLVRTCSCASSPAARDSEHPVLAEAKINELNFSGHIVKVTFVQFRGVKVSEPKTFTFCIRGLMLAGQEMSNRQQRGFKWRTSVHWCEQDLKVNFVPSRPLILQPGCECTWMETRPPTSATRGTSSGFGVTAQAEKEPSPGWGRSAGKATSRGQSVLPDLPRCSRNCH